MSDITLFENNALANSDLFKSLQDVNDNLLSGSGGGEQNRRISLNGKAFREIVNGEEVSVSDDNNMNMVILNAAKISRSFYEGVYASDYRFAALWSYRPYQNQTINQWLPR